MCGSLHSFLAWSADSRCLKRWWVGSAGQGPIMMQPLALASASGASSAKINPMVLFTICDSYIRRNEGSDRIIGTLLGNITDGVANITNCYTVPHNESMDQVCRSDRSSSVLAHCPLFPGAGQKPGKGRKAMHSSQWIGTWAASYADALHGHHLLSREWTCT